MMLRYQVNSHFLFKALNGIRALIGSNDEKARNIVNEMSEYFRVAEKKLDYYLYNAMVMLSNKF